MNEFYAELKKIAKASGQESDLFNVGSHESERDVDLLEGVEPRLVADIFKSAAKQTLGDSFWPAMASEVVRNCAVVARAFDCLPGGLAWTEEFVERPYSIGFIGDLALDDGPLVRTCIDAILNASENPDYFYLIEEFYTDELTEAMSYLVRYWMPMNPRPRQAIMDQIALIMHSAR